MSSSRHSGGRGAQNGSISLLGPVEDDPQTRRENMASHRHQERVRDEEGEPFEVLDPEDSERTF